VNLILVHVTERSTSGNPCLLLISQGPNLAAECQSQPAQRRRTQGPQHSHGHKRWSVMAPTEPVQLFGRMWLGQGQWARGAGRAPVPLGCRLSQLLLCLWPCFPSDLIWGDMRVTVQ
jgi:hypothetical protein